MKSNFLILTIIMCFCLIPVLLQAGIDPTIVLYLPFEEQSGKVAEDLSQFGHKAEFRKKTAWAAASKHGGCIELGIGNWLEVKDHDSLDLTNKMTIMFWSKLMRASGDVQSGVEKEPAWQDGEYNLCPALFGRSFATSSRTT